MTTAEFDHAWDTAYTQTARALVAAGILRRVWRWYTLSTPNFTFSWRRRIA